MKKEVATRNCVKEAMTVKFRRQDVCLMVCLWIVAVVAYAVGLLFAAKFALLKDANGADYHLALRLILKVVFYISLSMVLMSKLASENKEKRKQLLRGTRFVLRSLKMVGEICLLAFFYLVRGAVETIAVTYAESRDFAEERISYYEKQELRRKEFLDEDFDIEDYYVVDYDEEEYGPDCYLFADPDCDE